MLQNAPAPRSTAHARNTRDICAFPSPPFSFNRPSAANPKLPLPPAAGQRSVNRGVVAVVAANIYAGPDAHRALRRLERSRILLWLRVPNAVAAQKLPAGGHFAEPVFHLRDDETT